MHGQVSGKELVGPAGAACIQAVKQRGEGWSCRTRKVKGQPFSEAIRAKIQQIAGNKWDIQLRTWTAGPVDQGDVLLATIYFRTEQSCEERGEGQAEFVFELAREPWTKCMQYMVRAGYEWERFTIPFVVGHTFPTGEAQMTLRLGFGPADRRGWWFQCQELSEEVDPCRSAKNQHRLSWHGSRRTMAESRIGTH